MSGLKLKHQRGDDSTIPGSWFLWPSGWSSAHLCWIFIWKPPEPSQAASSSNMGDSESSPLVELHFILRAEMKWYCFRPHIDTDAKLCIRPNRLTCLLFTYVAVYRGGKSIRASTIDTTNTQWNNKKCKDVPVQHLNSSCSLHQHLK